MNICLDNIKKSTKTQLGLCYTVLPEVITAKFLAPYAFSEFASPRLHTHACIFFLNDG